MHVQIDGTFHINVADGIYEKKSKIIQSKYFLLFIFNVFNHQPLDHRYNAEYHMFRLTDNYGWLNKRTLSVQEFTDCLIASYRET